jgi:predicted AAA+ superfamily ATPase
MGHMGPLPRSYDAVLRHHLDRHRQMAFVSGPRQVGKTTTCRALQDDARYLNWDDLDDRRLLMRGPKAVGAEIGLDRLTERCPLVVLDEIHKYRSWRTLLKGLFDAYADRLHVVVTGSARLDLYHRGGESLMGRYLPYRMHPLSVGELLRPDDSDVEIRPPSSLPPDQWDALWQHGGFPEPFVKRDLRFTRRWRTLRMQQLVREEVRDLTRIQEIGQLEVLVAVLRERVGGQLSYSSLAQQVNVSVDTMRRWIDTLCGLYHGFRVRPWFRNVAKSLRKEPKWFLRDWGGADDLGARAENFVACHLLKAVESWQDRGLGTYELRYLRDKQKREVDFVVIRDAAPWFLVEVKYADESLSRSLAYFQQQTGAAHALQVVIDAPYVAADCFARREPCIVPARTLLSQLP